MATLFPVVQQFFDDDGDPLNGGKVYFYEAGTVTPKDTYTDSTENTANANPVILDASGRAPIWGSGSYKMIVANSSDVQVGDTYDNITLPSQSLTESVLNERNFVRNSTFRVQPASLASAPSDNDNLYPGWRILMENASGVVPTNGSGTLYNTGSDGFINFAAERTRLTVGSGEDGKFGLFQVIENDDINTLRGTRYLSLQCLMLRNANSGLQKFKMAILGWSGTADATTSDPISSWGAEGTDPTLAANWTYLNTPEVFTITTTGARYKLEAVTAGSYGNYAVLIWSDDRTTTQTTDWVEIANVKLERGATCSEYSYPNAGEENSHSRRYYQSLAGNAKVIGSGVTLTSTAAKILIPLTPTMRAVPTVAVSNVAHFTVDDGTGTPVACSGISLDSATTPEMAILSITTASGLTAGRSTYMLSANASATLELKSQL